MSHDVLRRMVSPPPPAPEDVPITSSRAMRLAVTRAADKTHDLTLSVAGLREELASLDAMLDMIAADQMIVSMMRDAEMVGLAVLDLQTRAALIEAQTIGKVLTEQPEERPATQTDVSMAIPLLKAILAHLEETALRTPLEGWGMGITPQGQVANARAAGLILPERSYRVIRITLDFQVADREGTLMMALPDHREAVTAPPPAKEDGDWSTRFQAMVNAAPVRLKAQLHRFKVPLYVAEGLTVGQVLPLPGCQVTSVKLLAADGRKVATARLGQSGGMRAIRVEHAAEPDLQALDRLGGAAALHAPMPDMGLDDMNASDAIDVGTMMNLPDEEPLSMGSEEDGSDEAVQMLDDIEAALAMESEEGATAMAWGTEEHEEDGEATSADLDWSAEGLDFSNEEN